MDRIKKFLVPGFAKYIELFFELRLPLTKRTYNIQREKGKQQQQQKSHYNNARDIKAFRNEFWYSFVSSTERDIIQQVVEKVRNRFVSFLSSFFFFCSPPHWCAALLLNECKRGYARSGTFVCQQKVKNRPKKRYPLKAPENYYARSERSAQLLARKISFWLYCMKNFRA